MTLDEKSAAVPGVYSFSDVVNEACDRLMDSQIKFSIRKIQQMEERLCSLEKELDDFINGKTDSSPVSGRKAKKRDYILQKTGKLR